MAQWTKRASSADNEDGGQRFDMERLVTRAQQGDEQAFNVLYRHYSNAINTYLNNMVGNDGSGSELTQETFYKAWSSLSQLRSPGAFKHWLYRIATNLAYDYQKHQHLLPTVAFDRCSDDYSSLQVEGPENNYENAELLREALALIPYKYRICLILYCVEGCTPAEIAEQLDIKESCVSKYVSRGRKSLQTIYMQLQLKGRRIDA
ncbi:RNA polymerase sigma factor [Dictyobacter aurantiacus]|uniref:RNA polymerase sigma factor n=1 Tax=Dictyobacter aurantiacus TaxID=1936993 RepID=A0A401ZJX1_9CHLR|nr:sigma-70 family RNA polymerase sigma factor [Dictyobacter aurantiacus]GCE07151.1 RNA polymerase sigma factor [Dictyobacter aurantiacus]